MGGLALGGGAKCRLGSPGSFNASPRLLSPLKSHRPDPAAGGGGRAPVAYLPLLLTAGGGGVGGFAGEHVELGLGLHHHSTVVLTGPLSILVVQCTAVLGPLDLVQVQLSCVVDVFKIVLVQLYRYSCTARPTDGRPTDRPIGPSGTAVGIPTS